MNLNKSTRYALYAVMEMASTSSPVTAGGVARRYGISAGVVAKVFQRLAHAGIAESTRGVGGGYRLAKKPSDLTVLDVLNVFEPESAGSPHDDVSLGAAAPRLVRLFDEVDAQARKAFASAKVETLVG